MPSSTFRLRSFFMPQAEQLGAKLLYDGPTGVFHRMQEGPSRGHQANYGINDTVLISSQDLDFVEDAVITDYSSHYLCVCMQDQPSMTHTPHIPTQSRPNGNVIMFAREEPAPPVALHKGDSLHSTSILFTREFFEEDNQAQGRDYQSLCDRVNHLDPELINEDLQGVMRNVYFTDALEQRTDNRLETSVRLVLARLFDWLDDAQNNPDGLTDDDVRLVSEMTRHIDVHHGQASTVDELARITHTGHTRLCKVFKQATGETIGTYARRRRLEETCRLLEQTDMPLASIAHEVGFSTPAAFSAAFRQATGQTPRAWRADHQ